MTFSSVHKFICSYRSITIMQFAAMLLVLCCGAVMFIDDLEHLHAAFFISNGHMPYRDFFEHHHSLFLFFLAPLFKILPQNAIMTLYVARVLMMLISCATLFYTYKIAYRFLGGKFCAWLSILILMSFYPILYMFSSVKPDTLMHFFFIFGLYHFFAYAEELKAKPLIIASTAFTLSFLSLQTAVFLIFPLIFIALYILYRHPAQYKNFALALPLPLILLGLFALYLYLTDSIEKYIQLCWIFNLRFFSLLDFGLTNLLPDFFIYIFFGYASYIYLSANHKNTFYTHCIALLLTASVIKNLIFPAYYPRYLIPCFFYTSLLCGVALRRAPQIAHNWIKASLATIWIINITITIFIYNIFYDIKVLQLIKPNERWLHYYSSAQNIYQPLFNYYWYAPVLASVDDYLFNRQPEYHIYQNATSGHYQYILYNKKQISVKYPHPRKDADPRFIQAYKRYFLEPDIIKKCDFFEIGPIGICKLSPTEHQAAHH